MTDDDPTDGQGYRGDGEPGDRIPPEATTDVFEAVFRHTNDAVFVVDVGADRILDCNRRASDLVVKRLEPTRGLRRGRRTLRPPAPVRRAVIGSTSV